MIYIKIISQIVILIGIILAYDARILTEKWFGMGDQNEGAAGMKILGFILSTIGGIILYNLK